MLIRAVTLIAELEKQMHELAASTLASPPEDYAKFMLAVGRYRELSDLRNTVAELARKNEDD